MKKGVLFVALFMVSTITFGQETGKWTLGECIDYALENNLAVQRSLLGVASSEILKKQTMWSMAPSFNMGASFGSSWGRSVDPTTNRFVTERFGNTGLNTSTSWLLYQSNRLRNIHKQSLVDFEASKYNLEAAKDQVILSVITFYTNIVFNNELYQNTLSQLNSTDQLLERTEKQVEAGAVPQTQLFDLIAQKASNEVQVINAENAYNFSILQLKQALQIPASDPFEIVVPDIELEVLPLAGLTAEDIYDIAMGKMPNIKSADLGVESADLGVKVAKAQLYPSLRFSGNINTNYSSVRNTQRFVPDGTTTPGGIPPFVIGTVNLDPTQSVYTLPQDLPGGQSCEDYPLMDQWGDNIGRSVSLSLSIPILNGLSASSNVQRSVITRRQAEITAKEQRNNLRQNIERAFNDVLAANRSYDQSLKQVEAQEESYRVTQRSYELGAMNFIDFQVAQNNLFQARTNLLLAKYDYIFKLKILDFYQDKPLEF